MASTRVDSPRKDSFSSYFAMMRDNLTSDHAGSGAHRLSRPISLSRRRPNDGEIDIFSAEKYFSGGMDEMKTAREITPPVPVMTTRAVSTSSEASGNSRSGLLRHHSRRRQSVVDQRRQSNGKKLLLGVFKCSCNGKDSVDAGDEGGEVTVGKERAPNLNPVAGKVTVGKELIWERKPKEEEDDDDINDDLRSESSSDLFEIESISVKSHPFFKREAIELTPRGEQYEPSEASIAWSVVTASAANLSVASEFGDDESKKKAKQQRSGLLMGCTSYKAVDVTTDKYYKPIDRGGGFERHVTPAMRYRIESIKKKEVGHGVGVPPVPLSR